MIQLEFSTVAEACACFLTDQKVKEVEREGLTNVFYAGALMIMGELKRAGSVARGKDLLDQIVPDLFQRDRPPRYLLDLLVEGTPVPQDEMPRSVEWTFAAAAWAVMTIIRDDDPTGFSLRCLVDVNLELLAYVEKERVRT